MARNPGSARWPVKGPLERKEGRKDAKQRETSLVPAFVPFVSRPPSSLVRARFRPQNSSRSFPPLIDLGRQPYPVSNIITLTSGPSVARINRIVFGLRARSPRAPVRVNINACARGVKSPLYARLILYATWPREHVHGGLRKCAGRSLRKERVSAGWVIDFKLRDTLCSIRELHGYSRARERTRSVQRRGNYLSLDGSRMKIQFHEMKLSWIVSSESFPLLFIGNKIEVRCNSY